MGKCKFNEGGLLYMVAHYPYVFGEAFNKDAMKQAILEAGDENNLFSIDSLAYREIRDDLARQINEAFGYEPSKVAAFITDDIISLVDSSGTKEDPIQVNLETSSTEDIKIEEIEKVHGKSMSLLDVYLGEAKTARGYTDISSSDPINSLTELFTKRYKNAFKVMNTLSKSVKRDIIKHTVVDIDADKDAVVSNKRGDDNLTANSRMHDYKNDKFKSLIRNYKKFSGNDVSINSFYNGDKVNPEVNAIMDEIGAWFSNPESHGGRNMSGSLLMSWSFNDNDVDRLSMYNDFVLLSNFDDIINIFSGEYVSINKNMLGKNSDRDLIKYTPRIDSNIHTSYTNEMVINAFNESSRLITDMIETTDVLDDDGKPSGRTIDMRVLVNSIDSIIDKFPDKITGYFKNTTDEIRLALKEIIEDKFETKSLISQGVDMEVVKSFYDRFYNNEKKSLYSTMTTYMNDGNVDSLYMSMISGLFLKTTRLGYNKVIANRDGNLSYTISNNVRFNESEHRIIENIDHNLLNTYNNIKLDSRIITNDNNPAVVKISLATGELTMEMDDNGNFQSVILSENASEDEAFDVLYEIFDYSSGVGMNPDKKKNFIKRFTVHTSSQSKHQLVNAISPAVYMSIQGARLSKEYANKESSKELREKLTSSILGKSTLGEPYSDGKVSVNFDTASYINSIRNIAKTIMDVDGESVKSTIKNAEGNQSAAFGLNSLITGFKRAVAVHSDIIDTQIDSGETRTGKMSPLRNNLFMTNPDLYNGGSIVDGVENRGKTMSGSNMSSKNVSEYDILYAFADQLNSSGDNDAESKIGIRPTTYSDKSRSTLAIINTGKPVNIDIDNLAFYTTSDNIDKSYGSSLLNRMIDSVEGSSNKILKDYNNNELQALYFVTQGDYYLRLNEQALSEFNSAITKSDALALLKNNFENSKLHDSKTELGKSALSQLKIDYEKDVEKYKKADDVLFKNLESVNDFLSKVNPKEVEALSYKKGKGFVKKLFLDSKAGGVPKTFLNNVNMFKGKTYEHEDFIKGGVSTYDFESYMESQLHQLIENMDSEGTVLTASNEDINSQIIKQIASEGGSPSEWRHDTLNMWEAAKRDNDGNIVEINPFIRKYFNYFNIVSTNFQNAAVGAEHQHKGGDRSSEFVSQLKRMVAWQATIHQYNVNTIDGINKDTKTVHVKDPSIEMQSILGIKEDFDANDGASFQLMIQSILEQRSLGDTKTGIHQKSINATMSPMGVAGLTKHAAHAITNEKLRGARNMSELATSAQYDLINLMKNTMADPLEYDDGSRIDLLTKFDGTSLNFPRDIGHVSYIVEGTTPETDQIITITNISRNEDGSYFISRVNETTQEDASSSMSINNMFDLWQALGGENSVNALNERAKDKGRRSDLISNGKQWEYSDSSWYALTDFSNIVGRLRSNYNPNDMPSQDNVEQPLKHKYIGHIKFESAQKAGLSNLTDHTIFTEEYNQDISQRTITDDNGVEVDNSYHKNNNPLGYRKINTQFESNQFMGIQLDASHTMDQSHLTTPTQIISALTLSGWTYEEASEAYDALAEYADDALRTELIKSFRKSKNQAMIDEVESGGSLEEYIDQISTIVVDKYVKAQMQGGRSVNDIPISTILANAFSDENSGLSRMPIDNPSVMSEFVAASSSFFTTNGIRSKLPGILAIISPPTFMSGRHIVPKGSVFRGAVLENDTNLNTTEFSRWLRENPKENSEFYRENVSVNDRSINKLRMLETITYTEDGERKTIKFNHPMELRDFKERLRKGEISNFTKELLQPNELRGPEIEVNISDGEQLTMFDMRITEDLFDLNTLKNSILDKLKSYEGFKKDIKSGNIYKKAKAEMEIKKLDDAFSKLMNRTNNLDFINYEPNMDPNNENGELDFVPRELVSALRDSKSMQEMHDNLISFSKSVFAKSNEFKESGKSSISMSDANKALDSVISKFFSNITTVMRTKQQDLIISLSKGNYVLKGDDLARSFGSDKEYNVESIDGKPSEMMLSHVFQTQFNLQVNDSPATVTEDVMYNRISQKSKLSVPVEMGNPKRFVRSVNGEHIPIYDSSEFDIPTGYMKDIIKDVEFDIVEGGVRRRLSEDGEVLYEYDPRHIEVKTYYDKNLDRNYDVWIELQSKGAEITLDRLSNLRNTGRRSDLSGIRLTNPSEDNLARYDALDRIAAKKMLSSFQKSLETVIGRIPAQGMQSFMAAKIVGFINTEANAVWTSPYVHWLEGSDFDIDKLNVMFYGVDKQGNIATWAPDEFTDFAGQDIDGESGYDEITATLKMKYPKKKYVNLIVEGDIVESQVVLNENDVDITTTRGRRAIISMLHDRLNNNYDETLEIYVRDNPDLTKDIIKIWNDFNSYKPDSAAVLNFTVSRIYSVINNPINARHALSPIEMDKPKAAKEKSTKGREVKSMTKNNPMSVVKMLIANMAGREVIGITASALKAFSVLTLWANKKFRKGDVDMLVKRGNPLNRDSGNIILDNKEYNSMLVSNVNVGQFSNPHVNLKKLSDALSLQYGKDISEEFLINKLKNEADTAVIISALLSAATDNAKELVLAAINAGPKTAGVYCYALMMGVPFDDIANFMLKPEIDLVVKYMESDIFNDPTGFVDTSAAINIVRGGPNPRNYNPTGLLGRGDSDDSFKPGIIDSMLDGGFISRDDYRSVKKTMSSATGEYVEKMKKTQIEYNRILLQNSDEVIKKINIKLKNTKTVTGEPNYKTIQFVKYLNDLKRYIISMKKNNISPYSHILDELEQLVVKGKELSILTSMLSLNQGLKSNSYDLVKFKIKVEKELQDQIEDFSLEKFILDEDYRSDAINSYIPVTFNILDVISEHPQFMAMLRSYFINDKVIKNVSLKASSTEDLINYAIDQRLIDAGSKGKFSENQYKKMTEFIDDSIILEFLKSHKYKFMTTSNTILPSNDKDFVSEVSGKKMDLSTQIGRARFLYWVDHNVIPQLKNKYKNNFFINSLVFDSSLGGLNVSSQKKSGYKLNVDMMSSSDDNVARIHALSDSFNSIYNIDFKGDGVTKSGEMGTIGEIMFTYDLLMNKGKTSKNSMNKIFSDAYPISKKSLSENNPNFDYNIFVSNIKDKLNFDVLSSKMENLIYYAPNAIKKNSKALIKTTFSGGRLHHTYDGNPIGFPSLPAYNEYFLKSIPEVNASESKIDYERIKLDVYVKESAFDNSEKINSLFIKNAEGISKIFNC